MVNITIYTAPGCGACIAAKRAMTKHEIPFTEVNTADDPAATAYVRDDLGYESAPVTALTYKDGRVHSWGGFDLEQIKHTRQILDQEGPGLGSPEPMPAQHGGPTAAQMHVAGAA